MFRLPCLFVLLAVSSLLQAEPVYFLVAEKPGSLFHFDSYVLPISDPAGIQHARDLIRLGPIAGNTIVFAKIAPGSDGINRDYLKPGAPLWNWHVTEFEGFDTLGIELLDGWPTYVGDDVPSWMANTGGHIGFWSYTVVGELTGIPEVSSLGLVMMGLLGLAAIYLRKRIARL